MKYDYRTALKKTAAAQAKPVANGYIEKLKRFIGFRPPATGEPPRAQKDPNAVSKDMQQFKNTNPSPQEIKQMQAHPLFDGKTYLKQDAPKD